MKYILTGKQMREADKFTIESIGIPSMVLMERAALGVVNEVEKCEFNKKKILVACGSGNNGGDGYAIARLLHLKGYEVSILFVGKDSSRSQENLAQKNICDYYQIPQIDVVDGKFDIIIDAVFGTGLSRNIEGDIADKIRELNALEGYKVAVDIPSGINDTTGLVLGIAFKADLTVAIAFAKRGIMLQPGNQYAGKVTITDIGINDDSILDDEKLIFSYEQEDLAKEYPKRKPNSHKGSYGKITMIVGSKGMAGAAFLSAKAAYMTGAGLVQIYTHEDNRVVLQQLLPEAIITTYESYNEEQVHKIVEWSDVIAIGCGFGTSETSKEILRYVLQRGNKTTIVDADGLNILSDDMSLLENCQQDVVLTPHMKEMSRLTKYSVKELQDNRVVLLENFVSKYPVTCVMKDARTLVAKKEDNIYLNTSGNAAMAKGGSGDVLAGIIAGTLAQTKDLFKGTCLAVYLHGLAGDEAKDRLGSYSVLASDIVDSVGEVLFFA